MKQILIQSLGKQILIDTQSKVARQILLQSSLPKVFIPDYFSSEAHSDQESADIYIAHLQSSSSRLSKNRAKNQYIIQDDWGTHCPTYLFSFLGFLFEELFRMDNLFVVHSSAVQSPKLNFIFLGGAGSGKTTTMLELINRHNFQFISNNKTVLSIDATGDLAIRAGTSGISVRKHLAIRNDLLRLSSSNKLEENYSRKMVTVSKKYVANLSNNKPIIIIDLLLNSGCNIFKVMDRDTAFIKLCPILMNVVDREVALFNWKEPLVTSFNNYAYKKKTLLAAHNIIQKNNIYSGLGSIAFITREIIKLNNSWK